MYRTLLRQLRRTRVSPSAAPINALHQNPNYNKIPIRSYAFSNAEDAAAERRQRKRRLRIEPPKWSLNSGSSQPQSRQNRDPLQPDSTSKLVGRYLSLHNRVQNLIRAGDLDSASAVARQSVFSQTRPTVFTCNAIIAAMYRANRHKDAISLFQYFFDQSRLIPNVISYNFLINAHFGNSGDVEAAMQTYNRIIEVAPFSPSSVTYRNLTKGLIEVGRIDDAVDMLREMLNKGQGADSLVYNNIISGFLELGNVDRANEFFEELQEKCTVYDGVVSASFMEWYFKQGKKKEAMEAYRYLMSKEFRLVPATSNVVLGVLVKYGMESEAWSFFKKMLDRHTPPSFQAVNSDTFNIMVDECFRLGDVDKAVEVFQMVGQGKSTRPFVMDAAGYNNMIARMCEVDKFEEAEGYLEVFRGKSLSTDVTTYRTFIEAYVRTGKVDEALEKYRDMVVAELRVIPEYANKWFSFLVENGKVKECVPVLMRMCERDPKPDATTFEVVIRGLCESDELDGCLYVLTQMRKNRAHATPGLKEYLSSVFEKHGKLEAVKSILDAKLFPEIPVPAWFEPLKSPPKDGFLSIFTTNMSKKDGPGQRSEGQFQNSGQNSLAIQYPGANSQLRQGTFSPQSQWQQGSVTPPHMTGQGSEGHSENSSANQFPGATSQHPPVASSQWQQGPSWQNSSANQFPGASSQASVGVSSQWEQNSSVSPQNSWQNSSANQFPQSSAGAPSQWQQNGSVPHRNSWQNSSANQFPSASSQSSVGAPSQWQQNGSVPPQNSWQNPSANQFPNASSQSSVGSPSQWQQNGSVSPQNSWNSWPKSSTNQFSGASSQPSVGAPSQWQQNGPTEGQRLAGWRPSSANQFPAQTSYPSASQVPWQASVPSGMNQNPSTSFNPPHRQGQSGRYPQSWAQPSQPQMPQQAAEAVPSEMPYDAVRYHRAK